MSTQSLLLSALYPPATVLQAQTFYSSLDDIAWEPTWLDSRAYIHFRAASTKRVSDGCPSDTREPGHWGLDLYNGNQISYNFARHAHFYKQESANTTRDEQSSSIPGAENKEVKPPNPLDTSQSDDSDTVSLLEARSTFDEEFNSEEQRDDDLLNRIPAMYRLLDLLRERGSGGLGGLGNLLSKLLQHLANMLVQLKRLSLINTPSACS